MRNALCYVVVVPWRRRRRPRARVQAKRFPGSRPPTTIIALNKNRPPTARQWDVEARGKFISLTDQQVPGPLPAGRSTSSRRPLSAPEAEHAADRPEDLVPPPALRRVHHRLVPEAVGHRHARLRQLDDCRPCTPADPAQYRHRPLTTGLVHCRAQWCIRYSTRRPEGFPHRVPAPATQSPPAKRLRAASS